MNNVARQSGLEVSPESAIRYHFKLDWGWRIHFQAWLTHYGLPHWLLAWHGLSSVLPRPVQSVAWGSFDNVGSDFPQSRGSKRPRWSYNAPFIEIPSWLNTGLSAIASQLVSKACVGAYIVISFPLLGKKDLKLPVCHLLSSVTFITWLQICSWQVHTKLNLISLEVLA